MKIETNLIIFVEEKKFTYLGSNISDEQLVNEKQKILSFTGADLKEHGEDIVDDFMGAIKFVFRNHVTTYKKEEKVI